MPGRVPIDSYSPSKRFPSINFEDGDRMVEVPLKVMVERLSSLIPIDWLTKCKNKAWIRIPGEFLSLGV
ncbi:hypothetical protein JCGZ_24416 [Jatropha curcas]|uniref:Uncharacterized protein n=1 Tax=Jatropha curcas TaxID=180498 RepID=A0A067JZG5_JATCU|nr:hypothetical protein JCGZ_24416 [Jatropha curcas]